MNVITFASQISGKARADIIAEHAVVAYQVGNAVTITSWNASFLGVAQPTQTALDAALAEPEPAVAQTVFPARQFIETLFTSAEQQAIFTAAQTNWQVMKFVTLVAATPTIDVTNAEFVADIDAVEAAGLLTSTRAAQVLAGTPAPTS